MSALRLLVSFRPASSHGLHCSVGANVGISAEHIFRAAIDYEMTKKKVAVRPFDPQTYTCEEVWLTILHIDEIQSPLQAALQKPDDDLPESPRASKYQYGAGLMIVDSPTRPESSVLPTSTVLFSMVVKSDFSETGCHLLLSAVVTTVRPFKS